ncbi:MAG: hypothetical protein K0U64_02865 [Actinomycetia bacterium]|nr:hypothetical protein [Actinomycetes bacterium]
MRRTFLVGLAAAIIGGIGIWLGTQFDMNFTNTIMGVGGGVILAVVPERSPLMRLVGFLIGYVLGAFFTAMVLGLIPGGTTTVGLAVAFLIIFVPIAIISGLTTNRIPAWTMLLGALVFTAGFTSGALAEPWTAAEKFPGAFFSILAMSGIGFLTVIVAELVPEKKRPKAAEAASDTPDPDADQPTTETSQSDNTPEPVAGGTQ